MLLREHGKVVSKGTEVSVWQLYNSLQRHGIASKAGVRCWLAAPCAIVLASFAELPACTVQVRLPSADAPCAFIEVYNLTNICQCNDRLGAATSCPC